MKFKFVGKQMKLFCDVCKTHYFAALKISAIKFIRI